MQRGGKDKDWDVRATEMTERRITSQLEKRLGEKGARVEEGGEEP